MNNCKYKYIIESDEEILESNFFRGNSHLHGLQTITLDQKDRITSLDESEKIIIWRGSEGDLATDIGEFLSEKQIQELVMELSSEYQKKKREKLRIEI